jgi:hypothetical protein
MRKTYLITVLVLIAVTLVGCGRTEVVCESTSPIEIALEGSTKLETAAPTEASSFSAGSELFYETSLKSETVAEAETTAETVDIPVEVPHTFVTEPQPEETEPTTEVIETYPPIPDTTKDPIPTPTEKAEETTAYPETTAETTKREDTAPHETTRETDPPHTTPQTEVTETTAETTVPEPIPEPVKTPYDAPFDMEYIKSELIALAESMGMTHRTAYKDGEIITPDNSSWELPITVNSSFCGEMLKRSLYDYVTSYAEYHLYGGEPITHFTIYVLPLSDGYEIYFLH